MLPQQSPQDVTAQDDHFQTLCSEIEEYEHLPELTPGATRPQQMVTGTDALPFDLAHVAVVVYAISLAVSVAILFGCLALIYSRVPNRDVPWRAVWPGALGATILIAVVDIAFPVYLTNISTIARFGTTIVFILIVLAWFYVLAVIILAGAVINALRVGAGR